MFMTDDLTCDDFLGGQLSLWQPRKGYRAGVDPVFLAASIPAKSGQSILELGCGVGTAMLCLGRRIDDLSLTGLEIQSEYAALARQNATENGIRANVFEGDIENMPDALRQRRFDHVMANPPYFDRAASTAASDAGREVAMGVQTPLGIWVKTAAKRCAPGGYVTFIHRAESLPDLLELMSGRLGSLEVFPLVPRTGRNARLILVRGRLGGRAAFRLHTGIVLHKGDTHTADKENYSDAAACVLRGGAALTF